MSLGHQAGIIAPPVTTSPSRTLIQELDIVLQGRLNLAFPVILNPCLPLVGDEPASNEIIIVSIELILTPAFSLEAFEKQGTLQNLGTERTGASGHARRSTINAVCRGNLEVAPLDIRRTQPIVQNRRQGARSNSLDPLIWTNTTNFCLLERCQQPGENCAWPRDIVVCHDDDRRFDLGNGLTYLNPLVRNGDVEDADVRSL